MKLTTFLFIISLMQVSAATFGQKVTLKQNSMSIERFFSEIRKQTGYDFVMEYDELKGARINANFDKASLKEVMDAVLKGSPLTYTIEEKTIAIKREDPSLVKKVMNYFEAINVEGKILDAETGKPIPRGTVKLRNSVKMVLADENGVFTFRGLNDTDVLVISAVGYTTQELPAKKTMVISLKIVENILEDVIVSTGYQQIKKGSTTGAVNVVTADELQKNPALNLMDRLEGLVPGVQVDTRSNTIQIRGSNTYTGGTPPLIVIDGFPAIDQKLTNITNSYNNFPSSSANNQPNTSGNAIIGSFNIADIESITFLKDAAASAIWGANAANGVIVITTKKGKRGKPSINYGSSVSISDPANFNNLTSMTNREYIDLEQELFDKKFLIDPLSHWRNSPVTEAQEWMFKVTLKNSTTTIAQRDSALNVLANRSNRDQIQDYLLQRAVTQQHNISFSGGSENATYYVSGAFNKDRPVFKSNSAEAYSMTSNLTNEFLNKKLTLTTGLNYNYSKSQVNSAALRALSTGSYGLAPYEMLADDQGNLIYKGILFTTKVSDSLTSRGYLPWTYNAVDELNYNNSIKTQNSVRALASLKGNLTDWLNITVSGQLQKSMTDDGVVEDLQSYSTRELINIGTTYNAAGAVNYGVPVGAVNRMAKMSSTDYSLRSQFNITKDWNNTHHFDMLGGAEIRESTYHGNTQVLYGYDVDRSTSVNVNTTITGKYSNIYGATSTLPSNDGTIYRSLRRYLSYFANAGYSYLGKYYATSSVRFDDINLLGVERRDRATPLWSGGLRWDIKKEHFMEDLNFLNNLSLRLTLGTGGNPPSTSSNYSTISTGTDQNTKLPIATILNYANPGVGWATTRMFNTGIDAGLLQNRLNFTLDIYTKRTYGLMIPIPINATNGITTLQYNAGDLAGHGLDFSVSGQLVKSKDWTWMSNFNFSYSATEITESTFKNISTNAGSLMTPGYPVDNIFVYRWAGLDDKGQSQIFASDGSILKSAGSPALKPEDLVYAGRSTAPYFGGLSSTVRYKNINLIVRAAYNLGHKFMLQNIDGGKYPTNGLNTYTGLLSNSEALANRWRKPGDEAFTNVPGITGVTSNSINRYMGADINLRDAGNIALQQISLSYTLSAATLKRMPFIKAANVGLTAGNLGMIWVANKEGINPNYQATNIYTSLPPSRSYTFSLNLSL